MNSPELYKGRKLPVVIVVLLFCKWRSYFAAIVVISQTQILFVDLCGVDIQVPAFKIIILDEADSLMKMLRYNTDHTLLLMCSFGCWI
jgi:hypothetical protein